MFYSSSQRSSLILPNLYISEYSTSQDLEWLLKNKITAIVNCACGEIKCKFKSQFTYLALDLDDSHSQRLTPYFNQVADFISKQLEKPNGKVLVHCQAGISRSVSMVCAYLIKFHSKSFPQALKLVREGRPNAFPNFEFQKQLKKYSAFQKIPEYHFSCQNCNTLVFSNFNLDAHQIHPNYYLENSVPFNKSKIDIPVSSTQNANISCSRWYTDKLDWHTQNPNDNTGFVHCPGCKNQIGEFFKSGHKCDCGAILLPALFFEKRSLKVSLVKSTKTPIKNPGEETKIGLNQNDTPEKS